MSLFTYLDMAMTGEIKRKKQWVPNLFRLTVISMYELYVAKRESGCWYNVCFTLRYGKRFPPGSGVVG